MKKRSLESASSSEKKSRTGRVLQLNSDYHDEGRQSELRDRFSQAKPFEHIFLENLVQDEEALGEVKCQLLDEQYFAKDNDLYRFIQTDDLRLTKAESLVRLREFIYSEAVVKLVESVSGCAPLSKTNVDLTGAIYRRGDTLLCHDDQLQGRRV